MGGVVSYVFAPLGELMHLPREVERCVAFLGCVRKGVFEPKGTGFFAAYPCGPNGQYRFHYLVTARHVIEGIRKLSDDGEVYVRINFLDRDCVVVRVSNDNWCFHDDDLVDASAVGLLMPEGHDHASFNIESFATQEIIEQNRIGTGSELFFPGLFNRHPGDKRNVPIVRMGSIASMPSERVQTKWGMIDAYLVEGRSIGGLSGSPVFVFLGRRDIGAGWWPTSAGPVPWYIEQAQFGPSFLLGMMHGHFGVKDVLDLVEDDIIIQQTTSVNMGIGIVIPAKHILSMLHSHPKLIEIRDRAVKQKLDIDRSNAGELD
jgi:hypothetical protein